MTQPNFSLNRIMQPDLSLSDFIQFAADCSASGVEVRNDLTVPSLLGGESSDSIQKKSGECGIEIVTVNALQRFNDPNLFEEKIPELTAMMEAAMSVGCRRIVLCPVNDPEDKRTADKQQRDLVSALNRYAELFEKYEMIGLVEPLGFDICSVRYKKQAVDAISETQLSRFYQIVHDTFHHYLSGEKESFPRETGLVHASGVSAGKMISDITDDDRVMVDENDIMDNKGQIAGLYGGGYEGLFSFEPFSPMIQKLSNDKMKAQIYQSMEYLFR